MEAGAAAEPARFAVCLAPPGLEDGARVQLERDFKLVTNRPVSFRLYSSSTREDQPGALVPIGDGQADTIDDGSDLLELPPIVTVLRARGRGEVTVRLEIHITELRCARDRRRRSRASRRDLEARLRHALRRHRARRRGRGRCSAPPRHRRCQGAAAEGVCDREGMATLTRDLETLFETRRDEWSMMTGARVVRCARRGPRPKRKKTADHEQRWLNLAASCSAPAPARRSTPGARA